MRCSWISRIWATASQLFNRWSVADEDATWWIIMHGLREKQSVNIGRKKRWKIHCSTISDRRRFANAIHRPIFKVKNCDLFIMLNVLKWILVAGTVGRKCNRTTTGTGSCSSMCCGRGYNMVKEHRVQKYNCKFHWCCQVECQEYHAEEWISVCK